MDLMIGGYIAIHSCDLKVQSLIFMHCTSSSTCTVVDGCHHPGQCVCACVVATLIGSTLSPRVLHNSASLILQQGVTYYSMIFANYKNLDSYSNGQGCRLLYLLLVVTSAHVVLYGILQYVQCTHHLLTFILLKVVCIPFLSANIRRCSFVKRVSDFSVIKTYFPQ